LLVTGAALAATGGVLLYLGTRDSSGTETTVGVACVPGACASTLRGRF
jgi:hypothetical protein